MKRLILLYCGLVLCITMGSAQTDSYTIDGQSYQLQTDVNGTITLLWNVIDQEYRYFAKKENTLIELTNTKNKNGYQEEYKKQLQELTAGSSVVTQKVKLTLSSLRRFFNDYNKKVDASYVENSLLTNIEYRLGGFLGSTNSVFVQNRENISNFQFGIDFELYDAVSLPSHAIVVQYKQTLSSDDFDYSASQFSINHRFKFIKTPTIQIFLNTKLVTYTFTRRGDILFIEGDQVSLTEQTGSNLQGPLIFGLGADIKLGNGYLSLNYNDAYSFVIDDNGEFPVDISIGYKFVL